MNLLIIGGTQFLGRHLVDSALIEGHTVTLFNRGKTNPGLFPDVERIAGDRDGGLDGLKGRTWDAVIDTCGYFPRVVAQSASMLADATGHYTFVSSVSAYGSFDEPVNEDTPVGVLDDPTIEEITGESYGPLKALCEQEVQRAFGARACIVRPGLIVGPFDPSDRFTYWPRRIARGGDVLAPGDPSLGTQFIDGRDLAAWILRAAVGGVGGVFNATGPATRLTIGETLDACVAAVNPAARLVWAPDDFLLEHDVAPWMGLPLWLPATEAPGLVQTDISRALAAGLTFRPVGETARDTYEWDAMRAPYTPRAGITPEREEELLAALGA